MITKQSLLQIVYEQNRVKTKVTIKAETQARDSAYFFFYKKVLADSNNKIKRVCLF